MTSVHEAAPMRNRHIDRRKGPCCQDGTRHNEATGRLLLNNKDRTNGQHRLIGSLSASIRDAALKPSAMSLALR